MHSPIAVTLERVADHRRRLRHPADRLPLTVLQRQIGLTVAGVFDVETDALMTRTRGKARVALARQVAMYLAHTGCGLSLAVAGQLFGRDRTTAAHACSTVEQHREDPSFDRALGLLEAIVRVLSWPRETGCASNG